MGALSYSYFLGQYKAVLTLVPRTVNVDLMKAIDVMINTTLKARACEAIESISLLAEGKQSTSRGELMFGLRLMRTRNNIIGSTSLNFGLSLSVQSQNKTVLSNAV